MSSIVEILIPPEQSGVRLDKALAVLCADMSRARLQALIAAGSMVLNDQVCMQPSKKVCEGDKVQISIAPPVEADPQPQDIPLDIIFEDEHLLVLNKQAGLVVHPGAGNHDGTLVNALLHHCAGNLSGIGGVLRPGIVHRLDKDTSGLMVAAKSDKAHQELSGQFASRMLSRRYKALVLGVPQPIKGKVDQPIGRHSGNRLKMRAGVKGGREAVTHYLVKERYGAAFSLLECRLESGRTHQIRVHMEHAGYPVIGDQLYGPQKTALQGALRRGDYPTEIIEEIAAFPRQALQAYALGFVHPISGEEVHFDIPLPDDFAHILELLES